MPTGNVKDIVADIMDAIGCERFITEIEAVSGGYVSADDIPIDRKTLKDGVSSGKLERVRVGATNGTYWYRPKKGRTK